MIVALAGCSMISYDASDSEFARNLVGDCHQTAIESALYKLSSPTISPENGTYLLQTGLPYNEWISGSYGQSWEKVAQVPIGSRIAVTRVFNQSWGKDGRYWLVYGRLVESDLPDWEFIIPSGNYARTGQIWISPPSPDAEKTPISFKPHFVKSCI